MAPSYRVPVIATPSTSLTPSPTAFDQIWSSAFALYKQQTQRDLASSPLLPNLHTIDDVLTQIEESSKTFGTWRSKHERVWGKLSACLGPLQVVRGVSGEVLQGAGNLVPGVGGAAAVLAAVVYLVKACDEVSNSYDLIESLFEELTEFTVRLGEYTKVEVGEAMRKKVVATLACMLEIIGRSEELIKTKRFRHFIGVAWCGKDEKTRDALNRFHKLIDSEERLVVAVTHSTVQNHDRKFDMAVEENKQSQKNILGKLDELTSEVTDSIGEKVLMEALCTMSADVLGCRYFALASVLMMANDIENATAAFAIALKPFENPNSVLEEETEATQLEDRDQEHEIAQVAEDLAPSIQTADNLDEGDGKAIDGSSNAQDDCSHPLLSSFGHIGWCDGPCHTPQDSYPSLYACRVCDDIGLCGPCLRLVKGKWSLKRICNVKHEYFKIFPLPKGSEDLAVKVVDGRVKAREEWLAGLRESFGGEETGGGSIVVRSRRSREAGGRRRELGFTFEM